MLAVGFSFPQASAHITNNMAHGFQHILDALSVLQSDVDDIQEKVSVDQHSIFWQGEGFFSITDFPLTVQKEDAYTGSITISSGTTLNDQDGDGIFNDCELQTRMELDTDNDGVPDSTIFEQNIFAGGAGPAGSAIKTTIDAEDGVDQLFFFAESDSTHRACSVHLLITLEETT